MQLKNIMFSHFAISFLITSTVLLSGCQSKNSSLVSREHASIAEQNKEAAWSAVNSLVTNERQLTFVGSKSGEGYFSPDATKMIFQSERSQSNPFYQMFIMDLQTGKTKKVSPGHGKTTCGWIHPSMNKVMYSSTHLDPDWKTKEIAEVESRKKPVKGRYSWSYDENYEIFSSNLEGKDLKRLTNAKGYDAEGSYSPDGQWIAFASNRNAYKDKLSDEDQKMFNQDASYMMDIYVMKSDGSQLRQLTTTKGYDGGPFFSADGKKITWRRFAPNGATAEIFTMNVDGTDQRQVTRLKSMSWAPFFHPSGDYIVFTTSVLGYANFELFIVDTEGRKEPIRLTFSEGFDGLPVFTPDGHSLSWTRRSEKGDSQIMMSAWDDAQARKLLNLKAWKPSDQKLSPKISKTDIKTWVAFLASEELKGRKTGSVEEIQYTEEIANLFKAWGLKPLSKSGYFQDFEYTSSVTLGSKNSLDIVGSITKNIKVQQEYIPLSYSKTGSFPASPVAFVGYGIKAPATDKIPEYDSYKGLDVKGKWVIAFADIPQDVAPEVRHNLNTFARLQHKVTTAKNAGAVGLIIVTGPLMTGWNDKFDKVKFDGSLSESSIAVLKMDAKFAEELLKKSSQDIKSLQAQLDKGQIVPSFEIPSVYIKAEVNLELIKSKGRNVVGVLKAPHAKSSVMIGAHGDHLGFGDTGGSSLAKKDELGKIHYGADDNASGVAGIMELAHSFSELRKTNPNTLKKDLIFSVWSGEEIGILGSSAFVKDFQKITGVPLDQSVSAYLNMDMIGRLRDRLLIQGVGSAKYWSQILEEQSLISAAPVALQEDPYLPTDSMALYLGKVPAITFFTGSHSDYHSPRDTMETLNYPGTQKVVEMVFNTTKVLSDSSVKMLEYVKVGSGTKQLEGRGFRIFLGTIPDYSQEGSGGVRISGTSKDSPAEVAGLKEKDIIVEFDGRKIENLYDYVYTLQAVKPSKETSIKILRAGQEKTFSITPKLKE